METQGSNHTNSKDFTTISPSAKALLFLKAHTSIPYMLEAAKLMYEEGTFEPDFSNRDVVFWVRVLHFESRYRSIDQLLSDLNPANILELSSGFSFRGLDAVLHSPVHYIDTDLPEVIQNKQKLVEMLSASAFKGKLELLGLNVLDEEAFKTLVGRFDKGEINIVNEGLLMYLNLEEKQTLCRIIRNILKEKGGYWITADIYVKRKEWERPFQVHDELQQFFEQHHIEENKFESFEAAEEFFKQNGFVIDKVTQPEREKLTALKYLVESASPEQLEKMRQSGRMQATWRLKAAN